MKNTLTRRAAKLRTGILLVAITCALGSCVTPVRADDAALQREIDALKQRLQKLEDELAKKKPEATAANADSLKTPRGSRVQISGFAEIRATNVGNPTGDRVRNGELDFEIARFRPRINYLLDDHWMATAQFNLSTRSAGVASVNTRDAYIQYSNAAYFVRLGEQKVPFGWEVFREGDEPRAALERARIMGILFPDERDIGAVASWSPSKAWIPKEKLGTDIPDRPALSIGVLNGDGINRIDGDPDKSFAVNAIAPIGPHNVVGASAYTGTTTRARPAPHQNEFHSTVKQAIGVEYRNSYGRFSTQAEYLWGHAFTADLNGGYGQLLYNAGTPGNVFVRHDVFDPSGSAVGDYWHRTGFGWYKDFTKQMRITAEYDLVHNKLTHTHNDHTFGLEVQANF